MKYLSVLDVSLNYDTGIEFISLLVCIIYSCRVSIQIVDVEDAGLNLQVALDRVAVLAGDSHAVGGGVKILNVSNHGGKCACSNLASQFEVTAHNSVVLAGCCVEVSGDSGNRRLLICSLSADGEVPSIPICWG